MGTKFADLVKAKLSETGMPQSRLAGTIGKSKAYITHVISGIKTGRDLRAFQPGADVVDSIARALGIPRDVAFEAAGLPVPDAPPVDRPNEDNTPAKPSGAAERSSPAGRTESMFDIAYNAALRALEGSRTQEHGIKIGIPGKMHITLFDETLTTDEIALYRRALLSTYEAVSQQIADARS